MKHSQSKLARIKDFLKEIGASDTIERNGQTISRDEIKLLLMDTEFRVQAFSKQAGELKDRLMQNANDFERIKKLKLSLRQKNKREATLLELSQRKESAAVKPSLFEPKFKQLQQQLARIESGEANLASCCCKNRCRLRLMHKDG